MDVAGYVSPLCLLRIYRFCYVWIDQISKTEEEEGIGEEALAETRGRRERGAVIRLIIFIQEIYDSSDIWFFSLRFQFEILA